MTVVFGTVVDASANPEPSARITIRLVAGSDPDAPGYLDPTEIFGTIKVDVDVDGTWTAELTPNGDIVPAGTVYAVTYVVKGRDHTSHIEVPDDPTPQWVGDLLVDAPEFDGAPGGAPRLAVYLVGEEHDRLPNAVVVDPDLIVSTDAAGDVAFTAGVVTGDSIAGGVTTGTAWHSSPVYTLTENPVDHAIGTPFLADVDVTLDHEGDEFVGPLQQTGATVGPMGYFNLQGDLRYRYSTGMFGGTGVGFLDILTVRNDVGSGPIDLTPGLSFGASRIYLADGAAVEQVGGDWASGAIAYGEAQVFITADSGSWDGVTNDTEMIGYKSGPYVYGNASLAARVAFDVDDLNVYPFVDYGDIVAAGIGVTRDAGDGSVAENIGVRIVRLEFGDTNVGIRCNSSFELWEDTVTFTESPADPFEMSGTYTLDFASAGMSLVHIHPTVVFEQAASPFGAVSALNLVPSLINDSSLSGEVWPSNSALSISPLYTADTTSVVGSTLRAIVGQNRLSATNGGDLSVGTAVEFAAQHDMGADVTVLTRQAVKVSNATGDGSMVIQTGVHIDSLTAATTNVSIMSEGSGAELRHAGPAVFGTSNAPTNSSVGLELRSTTKAFLLPRLTTAQRNALTGAGGMLIFNTSTSKYQGYDSGAWFDLH